MVLLELPSLHSNASSLKYCLVDVLESSLRSQHRRATRCTVVQYCAVQHCTIMVETGAPHFETWAKVMQYCSILYQGYCSTQNQAQRKLRIIRMLDSGRLQNATGTEYSTVPLVQY